MRPAIFCFNFNLILLCDRKLESKIEIGYIKYFT